MTESDTVVGDQPTQRPAAPHPPDVAPTDEQSPSAADRVRATTGANTPTGAETDSAAAAGNRTAAVAEDDAALAEDDAASVEDARSATTGTDAVRGPGAGPRHGPQSRTVLALLVPAVALLGAATAVFAWRADDSADELAALRTSLDTDAAAERTAADYALRVSQVKAGDVEGWRAALKTGVTDQLAAKLSAAVDVVGPWLSQIDYSSTAQPLAAEVTRRDGDAYVVQVFVDMTSRSRQTPDGVVATAAYTVTLDRSADWTITEVGGVAPDLPVPTTQAPR